MSWPKQHTRLEWPCAMQAAYLVRWGMVLRSWPRLEKPYTVHAAYLFRWSCVLSSATFRASRYQHSGRTAGLAAGC